MTAESVGIQVLAFPIVNQRRGDRVLNVVAIESCHVRPVHKFGASCSSEAKPGNLEIDEPSMLWSKFAERAVRLMLTVACPSTKIRHEELCAISVTLMSVQVEDSGRKASPV